MHNTLQIPDSHYEEKNTQNEHIIVYFEYFLTYHYSKIVWLAGNLNEIKIDHYEKIFSHVTEIHHIKTIPKNNFQNICLT